MTVVPTPSRLIGLAALAAATGASAALCAGAALAQPAPPADFAICSACHESTPKAAPSVGPNLFGVGGRKAGTAPDVDYSDALKNSGITWSADTLAAFILDPAKAVPGNKMDYGGATDAKAAKALADYLMSLKG